MPQIYTYSEARQNLASILEQAAVAGEVQIRRKDGSVFALKPVQNKRSPLDVEGIDLDLTADEIVMFIAEGRRDYGREADDAGLFMR